MANRRDTQRQADLLAEPAATVNPDLTRLGDVIHI